MHRAEVIVVAGLAIVVSAARAQSERDSPLRQERCRREVSFLEAGPAHPRYAEALEIIPFCEVSGGAALARLWRTTDGASPLDLYRLRDASRRLRDGGVLRALYGVVRDSTRPLSVRLAALDVLVSYMAPGKTLPYGSREPGVRADSCGLVALGALDVHEGASPIPYLDSVNGIQRAIFTVASVSGDSVVRQAAHCALFGKHVPDRWDTAAANIRRLPPSAFGDLPEAIRRDLERRKCTVPQIWDDSVPHNVVRGHFARPGQTDWAVLCSRNGVSAILVFWHESADTVAELDSMSDGTFLQGVGGGQIGYSRQIGVADSAFINRHYGWYGGPEPPPLDHEGIDDAFVEKASVVHYWYEGRWLRLTGAD